MMVVSDGADEPSCVIVGANQETGKLQCKIVIVDHSASVCVL